ncbi:MAG: alanine racemase, partial [Planctomycetes bacterium]|nr:alanine racemase [Planctomycetota bacterium]
MRQIEKLGPRWLEIDLGAFARNLDIVAKAVAPAQLIPVIKADAYGHGAVPLARQIEKQGFELVAVATLEEAIALRRAFLRIAILVLGAVPEAQIADLLNYGLTPTVCEPHFAEELDRRATELGCSVSVHLYTDTGMGRMGLPLQRIGEAYEQIRKLSHIRISGVYTHFPAADEEDEASRTFTEAQWRNLRAWTDSLDPRPLLHLANSAAVLEHTYTHEQAVRPGLLLYGVSPLPSRRLLPGMAPVMSLRCRPLFIKTMEAGEVVGYGRIYKLKSRSRIMTLPAGYADGIPRRIGPFLEVSVKGRRYPVAGRICMDMMMVDIGLDAEIDTDD